MKPKVEFFKAEDFVGCYDRGAARARLKGWVE